MDPARLTDARDRRGRGRCARRGSAAQKRLGEDATHDWLLDLDADEVVTPELAEETAPCSAVCAAGARVRDEDGDRAADRRVWGHHYNLVDAATYDRRVIRQPDHANWDQFKVPPPSLSGASTPGWCTIPSATSPTWRTSSFQLRPRARHQAQAVPVATRRCCAVLFPEPLYPPRFWRVGWSDGRRQHRRTWALAGRNAGDSPAPAPLSAGRVKRLPPPRLGSSAAKALL